MIEQRYKDQVHLLLQALPYVAKEKSLALKGGTAINLFVHEMPRLSVDIDLVYLPLEDRETALANISGCLKRISDDLKANIPNISVTPASREGEDVKINCQIPGAQIKIEVNTVTRGHAFPLRRMEVNETVEEEFGKFAAINIISQEELFGGKICAALDRQHPRDLFDIKQLFENGEGLTTGIKNGFLIALISHMRPINEVIKPAFLNQKETYTKQFSGMTAIDFSYEDFEETREKLVKTITEMLTDKDKRFLISFKKGEPDWSLFPVSEVEKLPAVQWKLHNINKLKEQNPDKHNTMVKALEDKLLADK